MALGNDCIGRACVPAFPALLRTAEADPKLMSIVHKVVFFAGRRHAAGIQTSVQCALVISHGIDTVALKLSKTRLSEPIKGFLPGITFAELVVVIDLRSEDSQGAVCLFEHASRLVGLLQTHVSIRFVEQPREYPIGTLERGLLHHFRGIAVVSELFEFEGAVLKTFLREFKLEPR